MRHITDEDLTLLFYGEHEDPALAVMVADSEALSARYDALCAELKLADAYQPPQRGDDYGAEVWQRISPHLGYKEMAGSRFSHWLAPFLQPRFSLAGALSIVLVAALAFTLGRNGGPEVSNGPVVSAGTPVVAMADIDSSRLLNRSVAAHLEQVNIVLTQFVNTSVTSASETGHVTDILVANRLYRQAAVAEGDQKLAAFLADLEPLLIELAYQAQSGSAATRERMQQEVKDGLLFRVRVMNKQLNKPEISV
ncbi:MAG: hypothetical protein WBS20_00385, partial [Lysobacterales bacterium]